MQRISLIATVWNDLEGTRKFLQRMEEQTRRPDEIVVCDARSTDGTWELLEEYAANGAIPLVAIVEDRCSPARGRNLAAEAATHDILAVTDIGCDWEPQWFENLVVPFEEDPGLDAVMGSWRVRWEDQETSWAKADYILTGGLAMRADPTSHSANRSIAYKKDFYLGLGGLPEDLTYAADDMSLALFIQHASDRIGAAPEMDCIWERPQTLKALLKEARRNFRGAGEAGIWLKDIVFVTGKIAVELATLLLLSLALILGWPAPAVLGLFAVFLVLAALRICSLLARRGHVKRTWNDRADASLWHMLVLDYGRKIYYLRGFIQGALHGNKHCTGTRTKLREAGVGWWQ